MKLDPDCVRDLMLFCEEHTYIKTEEIGRYTAARYHVLYVDSMGIASAAIEQIIARKA